MSGKKSASDGGSASGIENGVVSSREGRRERPKGCRGKASKIGLPRQEVLTDYEEHFDDNVTDHGRPVGIDEARVIGNDYCHVKGRDENQPVPAGLEAAVMTEDEMRLFDRRRFVFR